jgi:hypothetical protein
MAGHVQQQPSKGLKPLSRLGLSDSDRGKGLPERKQPMHVETKKKGKPKTAAAGGGMNPPNKPPKGPTGGDNKGPKNPKDKEPKNPKGTQFSDNKGLQRMNEGQKPRDYKKPDVKITRDQKGHDSSMGGLRKSTKKDK